MTMQSHKLVYAESEEGWTGTVQVPALADCAIQWSVDGESIDGPRKPEQSKPQRTKMPVVLLAENGDDPSDVQRRSLETFLAKQDAICKRLLKYALQEISAAYYDESLPPLDDCNGKQKSIRKKFNTVAGFQELIEATGIFVREDEKNGAAYISVDFNTALDEEHGFSILLHNGQPLGWAGSGEMGGDIPPESTTREKDDYQAELAEYAEARSRFADALKLATDPGTAAEIADQLPPLIERLKAALAQINARINDPDPRSRMAAIRMMQKDPACRAAGKKLNEQTTRIAKDKNICKVLDPAMKNDPDWERFKTIIRKHG
jgi:hypothetical protein